jgi:hypothetical protein
MKTHHFLLAAVILTLTFFVGFTIEHYTYDRQEILKKTSYLPIDRTLKLRYRSCDGREYEVSCTGSCDTLYADMGITSGTYVRIKFTETKK